MRTLTAAIVLLTGIIAFTCVTLADPCGRASTGAPWHPVHAIVTSLALDSPALCDTIPYAALFGRTQRLVPRDLSGWHIQQVNSELVTLTGYDTARGELGRREVVVEFRTTPGSGSSQAQGHRPRVASLVQ